MVTPEKRSNPLALSSLIKKVGTRCRSPSCERSLERCSSNVKATEGVNPDFYYGSEPVARVTLYRTDKSTFGDLVGTTLLAIPLGTHIEKIKPARKPMTASNKKVTSCANDPESQQQKALENNRTPPTLGIGLHSSCDSPNTSRRRFALCATSVCLVGENPTCSVPASISRDARVYDHTTTAMHKLSPPPPVT